MLLLIDRDGWMDGGGTHVEVETFCCTQPRLWRGIHLPEEVTMLPASSVRCPLARALAFYSTADVTTDYRRYNYYDAGAISPKG